MKRFICFSSRLASFLLLSTFAWGQEAIYVENFDYPPGNIPAGWTITGEQPSSWSLNNSQISGGTAPELYMTYGFQAGVSRLVSPAINVSGHSKLSISYLQYLINYAGDWGETIGMDLSFDNGETWETLWEKPLGLINIPQDEFTYYFHVPDGASEMRFAFRFEGNNNAINGWAIDNIRIETIPGKDLIAYELIGTNTPIVGEENFYAFLALNGGTEIPENYTVKLMSGNQILYSTNGTPVEYGQTAFIPLFWTPNETDLDLNNLYALIEFEGDVDLSNNSTHPIALNVQQPETEMVQVGQGSYPLQHSVPYNFFNLYSLSQTMYLSNQINVEEGRITGIQYVSHFDEDINDVPIQILMAETNQSNLESGWLNPSEFTLVFDGTLDFKKGLNNLFIPLQTPYDYQGGNLVIYSNKSFPQMVLWSTFMSAFQEDFSIYSRLAEGDAEAFDPMNPASGYPVFYVPNISLFFNNGEMSVIDSNLANSIQVYPNPVKDQFFVVGNDGAKIQEVQIINSLGQTVMKQKANNTSIQLNLTHLSKGFYIAQIWTNKGIVSKKILVQ